MSDSAVKVLASAVNLLRAHGMENDRAVEIVCSIYQIGYGAALINQAKEQRDALLLNVEARGHA